MKRVLTGFCLGGLILASPCLAAPGMKEANELLAASDYAKAAQAYESLPVQGSKKREGWRLNNLGYCLIKLEKAGQAAESLEKAVAADSKNFTAWSNLGAAYETVGDKVKAADTFRRALELIRQENAALATGKRPKDAEAALHAAAAAGSPTAEAYVDTPSKLKGDLLKAALKAASDLLDGSKFTEAAAAYERIGITTPAKREGWRLNNWGLALIRSGEYLKAVPRLKKSVEIFPDNPKAWNNLGVAYENLGLTQEAKDAYAQAAKSGQAGEYDPAKAELNQLKLDFNAEKKKWEAAK